MKKCLIFGLLLIFYTNVVEADAKSSLKICQKLEKKLGYSGMDSIEERVSPMAFRALDDYKSIFYSTMNSFLRSSKYNLSNLPVSTELMRTHLLDTIFYNFPALPENLILFRGSSLGYRKNQPYRAEEIFTEFSYVSTSADIKVAESFSHSINKDDNGQVMALYFQKGLIQKGLVLCDEKESEVLLPHKISFRVMDEVPMSDPRITLSLVQICTTDQSCEFEVRKDVVKKWEKIRREQLKYENDI